MSSSVECLGDLVMDKDKKPLPLVMGDKLIGAIHIDDETGEISGQLVDVEFVSLLKEFFNGNLLEVSFFGKPAFQSVDAYGKARMKMDAFLNSKDNNA